MVFNDSRVINAKLTFDKLVITNKSQISHYQ